MGKKLRLANCIAGALTASTMTAVAPVYAQGDDELILEEVLVTAQRRSESLQDVPISITVYDQKALDDRNITIAKDIATFTPSVSVNERYGPEKSSFSIRGFNQDQNTAPTVGVYFAEVVGVRAQGGTTSGNTVGAGSFMDLQNVQVLKGPQGTLFGRNTNGGAILLVPQKPNETLGGYIEGSAGNYDMRRFHAVLNLPVSDNFRLRFAVDDNSRDGFMNNKSGIGPDDYNDRDYTAFRASAVWDITPELENYSIFHLSDSESNGYASRLVDCDRDNPQAMPDGIGQIGINGLITLAGCEQIDRQNARGDGPLDIETKVTNPYIKIKQWQFINTTTWAINENMTLKNIFSYGEFEEKAHFDLFTNNFSIPTSVNFINLGFPAPVVPGRPFKVIELDVVPGQSNAAQKTWTEELQLQGSAFDQKLDYVVGGYLEFSRPDGLSTGYTSVFATCDSPADLDCDFTAIPFAGNISESATEFEFENHGIFAQGTYDFNEQWALTAGIRYTFDKIEAYNQSSRLAPSPFDPFGPLFRTCSDVFRMPAGGLPVADASACGFEIEQDSKEPTWVINLDYKPDGDTLYYAKYARGYRQGGISFTNPGLETWEPEQVDNYELGAKYAFTGDIPGYFNIAAFYNDYTDQQVFGALITDRVNFPNVSGGNAILNAGESEISGIEFDTTALFFGRLQVTAAYTYLQTEIKEIDVGSISLVGTPFLAVLPTAEEGGELNYAPEHKLSLTTTYLVPIPADMGDLSIGMTYTFTDEQLADGNAPRPTSHLPATDLFNLNLNWERVAGSNFDLALFATNVTDKEYPVATGGAWGSFGVGDWLYAEPRMYGARLRYNFGG